MSITREEPSKIQNDITVYNDWIRAKLDSKKVPRKVQTKVIENSQNYIMSKMKAGGANPDEDTELNRHIE
jgi:hypothetical protein